MEKGPESRRAVKAKAARKRKASKTKKAKRKYRSLDGGKGATDTSEDEGPRTGANEGTLESREVNSRDGRRPETAANNGPA